jgi:hypothetical protein
MGIEISLRKYLTKLTIKSIILQVFIGEFKMSKIIITAMFAAFFLAVGAPLLSSAVISYTESMTKSYLPLDLVSIPKGSLLDVSMAQSCRQPNYGGIDPSHCERFEKKCDSDKSTGFYKHLCR